eukprot:TRINITY_DN13790_c0_g1_i1.p1 TRINITY_DN13790_c0_g1~~TRINITY_DN13790_c0_g1_i1.p1  ORF type:complete len:106 (+),score=21.01 TRINITY_DN13790_c0_g1_i1:143-460(+)
MSVPGVRMAPYPSDTDQPVHMSGHLPHFSQSVTKHQVLEVTGAHVASSRQPEQNTTNHARDKQSDNIGSIITMLISDQSVDLDDYLTDPVSDRRIWTQSTCCRQM